MPAQRKRKQSSKNLMDSPSDNTSVYCICRSGDGDRFMIACDRCEEWFHGDCINVTPKQAEQIKTFYCHECRSKEKTLEIEYKSARGSRAKPRTNTSPNNTVGKTEDPSPHKQLKNKSYCSPLASASPNSLSNNIKPEFKSPLKDEKEEPLIPEHSHLDTYGEFIYPSSPTLNYYPRSSWPCTTEPFADLSQTIPHNTAVNQGRLSSPRSRPCGSCTGCTRPEDCGKCDYCRDRRKFGGPNRMRQKCRLRQCSGYTIQPKQRSINVHGSGSRRRKQPTVIEPFSAQSSPNSHQYNDFEDEPFEVPSDFSPRPLLEHGSPSLFRTQLPDGLIDSSKVRRGDRHISYTHDLDPLSLRTYPRLSLESSAMDLLHDDSDDEVMISGDPHCAGPACMSAPLLDGKYCSESCRIKHSSSKIGPRYLSRTGPMLHETPIPYNLPYPDHMYCLHHSLVYPNPFSSSSYGKIEQSYDPTQVDDHHLIGKMEMPRQHYSLPYSHSIHPTQRFSVHNSLTGNPNNRLPGLDASGQVMCDPTDTAFIESAIRRNVVPFDEMDLELPAHSAAISGRMSMSPVFTSVGTLYAGRSSDVLRPAIDLRHGDIATRLGVGLDDAISADHDSSQLDNHYYYMMPYHSDPLNGHIPRNSYSNPSSIMNRRNTNPSARSRNVNNRLVFRGNTDISTGLSSSFSVGRASPSVVGTMKRMDITRPTMPHGNAKSSLPNVMASPLPTAPVPNFLPASEEFYTFNDSDALDINWPQESTAGVNS